MRITLFVLTATLLATPALADQIIRQSGSDWIVEDVKPGGFFAGVAAAKKAQAEQDMADAQIRRSQAVQRLSPSDWEKIQRTREFLRGTNLVEYPE